MFKTVVFSLLSMWILARPTSALELQDSSQSVIELNDLQPLEIVFRESSSSKPLVIKDLKSATRYFNGKDIERIVKKVDFRKQSILIFAWSGSGQDRLDVMVSKPAKSDSRRSAQQPVEFRLKRGRTRDLRRHVRIFAIPRDLEWSSGGGRAEAGNRPSAQKNLEPGNSPSQFIRMNIKGKLKAGVFAIGGETSGFEITSNDITLELEFSDDRNLEKQARNWNGRSVVVNGELTRKQGVEIQNRWIVRVTRMSLSEDREANK